MDQETRGIRIAGWALRIAALAWIGWDIARPPAPLWVMIALIFFGLCLCVFCWTRRRAGAPKPTPRHQNLAILLCVMAWLGWTVLVKTLDLKSMQRVSQYSYAIAWLVIFPVLNWALNRGSSRQVAAPST